MAQHTPIARVTALMGHLHSNVTPVSSLSAAPLSGSESTSGRLEDVVIVGFARTPIGCGPLNGALSSLNAPTLGSIAIREAVRRAGIEPELVEECFMGNVLGAGIGQAPARQAAIKGKQRTHKQTSDGQSHRL